MESFELVITGGRIIDGTGSSWFYADIGLHDGRIAAIVRSTPGRPGPLVGRAREVLDVHGLTVAPGFIDMHSHSDVSILAYPTADSKVTQGVTTEVFGQCGYSAAPLTERSVEPVKAMIGTTDVGVDYDWQSYADLTARIEARGTALNLAGLVGHGTVRMNTMGFENRRPTAEELDAMRRQVAEAMRDGAFGLSTGLIYTPGSYSETAEVVELAKVAAEHGGVYFTHMRSEGRGLMGAVAEAITIGREAHLPVQISHLKCAGPAQGTGPKLIETIQAARAEGIEVTGDHYPYTAGATSLSSLLPPWAHEGGQEALRRRLLDPATRARMKTDMRGPLPGWDNDFATLPFSGLLIATCPDKSLEGRSVEDIAAEWGKDVYDTVFDILLTGLATGMVIFMMRDDDMRLLLTQEFVMVGSDTVSLALGAEGRQHPRTYGTFPRVLGQCVRDEKLLPLEQAVRKMTGFPATKLGLRDRGLLREGLAADITVFDPATIADTATYADPNRFATGIAHVLVNGRFTLRDGRPTGALPGRMLRRGA
ncbi:MAG: N-acyl-D-amino-acid deacylase family protein [Bacillota bacterium]